MADGTPQEAAVADRPDGVIARLGHPAVGLAAPILVPPGVEDPGKKPLMVVTITMHADGGRGVEAKSNDGSPVSIGRIREVLRESKEHFDDKVLTLMVRGECERVLRVAAEQTKDRNLMARLMGALKH